MSQLAGTRALVIGGGSIGQRHLRLLGELGADARVLGNRALMGAGQRGLDEALSRSQPDYVVVANPTTCHVAALDWLAESGFAGRVLVEKPLSHQPVTKLEWGFGRAAVAYNMRFHPVVEALRRQLAGEKVISVRMHVGQHLADWRPGRDYKTTSSASLADGGGVLRDLSHELDLLIHLFGDVESVTSRGGSANVLGIETDESWAILAELESGAHAVLSLNYYDRPVQRTIAVNTASRTIVADLVSWAISVDGDAKCWPAERDAMYVAEHLAMFDEADTTLCTVAEAGKVLRLIAAVEEAAQRRAWIRP